MAAAAFASSLVLAMSLPSGRLLSEAGGSGEELPPGALRRLRTFLMEWYASLDEDGENEFRKVMTLLGVLLIPLAATLCACCQTCLYEQAQKPYRGTML